MQKIVFPNHFDQQQIDLHSLKNELIKIKEKKEKKINLLYMHLINLLNFQ